MGTAPTHTAPRTCEGGRQVSKPDAGPLHLVPRTHPPAPSQLWTVSKSTTRAEAAFMMIG